jgi:hypothetical protein
MLFSYLQEFDDEEQSEENDRFVAQLYKFMDDRCEFTPFLWDFLFFLF